MKYVVGNWKMNKTAREAVDFIETFLPLVEGCEVNFLLAVPFTSIAPASLAAKHSPLVIGAQNMHEAREGAFTGEISSLMLKEAGASFVILGHSERRSHFSETDQMIQKKLTRALADDLIPLFCVGETLEERESKKTEKRLKEQLRIGLEGIQKEDAKKILIAYEPVWAIGTGKAATAEIAEEAHALIRSELKEIFDKRTADEISILYGGSVQSENAANFMKKRDIDGVLAGGSSLDAQSFASIIKSIGKP